MLKACCVTTQQRAGLQYVFHMSQPLSIDPQFVRNHLLTREQKVEPCCWLL